jgi:hypothetical protein
VSWLLCARFLSTTVFTCGHAPPRQGLLLVERQHLSPPLGLRIGCCRMLYFWAGFTTAAGGGSIPPITCMTLGGQSVGSCACARCVAFTSVALYPTNSGMGDAAPAPASAGPAVLCVLSVRVCLCVERVCFLLCAGVMRTAAEPHVMFCSSRLCLYPKSPSGLCRSIRSPVLMLYCSCFALVWSSH